jgi:hypothetical protein
MNDVTVACVLKTGRFNNRHMNVEYCAENVIWLKRQVEKHLSANHRFVCLTDLKDIPGVETVPLVHDWPGWWSKIELFRPDNSIKGHCFYIDLDTAICGDFDHIAVQNQMTVLRRVSKGTGVGSGLMAWRDKPDFIYEKFCENPDGFISAHVTPDSWGDQGFIQDCLHDAQKNGLRVYAFQEIFGNQVICYKYDVDPVEHSDAPPDDARIVVFNGRPKPWHVAPCHKWIAPRAS